MSDLEAIVEKTQKEGVPTEQIAQKIKEFLELEDLLYYQTDLVRFLSKKLFDEYYIEIKPETILDKYLHGASVSGPKELLTLLDSFIETKKAGGEVVEDKYLERMVGVDSVANLITDIINILREEHKLVFKSGKDCDTYLAEEASTTRAVIKNCRTKFSKCTTSRVYKNLKKFKYHIENKWAKPKKKYFYNLKKEGSAPVVNVKLASDVIQDIEHIIEEKYNKLPITDHAFNTFLAENLSLARMTIYNWRKELQKTLSIANFKKLKRFKEQAEKENIELPEKYFWENISAEELKQKIEKVLETVSFKEKKSLDGYLSTRTGFNPDTFKRFRVYTNGFRERNLKLIHDELVRLEENYENRELEELEPFLKVSYLVDTRVIRELIGIYLDMRKTTITNICKELHENVEMFGDTKKPSVVTIYDSYYYMRSENAPREIFNTLIKLINAKIPKSELSVQKLLRKYYSPLLSEPAGLLMKYAVNDLLERNYPESIDEAVLEQMGFLLKKVRTYQSDGIYEPEDLIHHKEWKDYGFAIEAGNGKVKIDFLNLGEKTLIMGGHPLNNKTKEL